MVKKLMLSALGLAVVSLVYPAAQFPTNAPQPPLNVLTPQEKEEGWKLLFSGTSLGGWENDKGDWRVEDGVIVSRNGPGHLFSRKKYKNFELSWNVCAYDVAVPKKRFGNPGVFLRGIKTGRNFPQGYEVQVDPYDIKNPTGGLYGLATGDLLVKTGHWNPTAFLQVHEGKWIRQRARIVNQHITVWINGEKTLAWSDPQNRFPEAGYIALQNHHATDVVLFADVKIKELD